ncbi:ricin-type beta-trefoil lectin domain protein [Streptomyces sp. CBMA152]|uniref:ricin-type beta-trefoil lectin domain protein n=1 Tax=Streptomyces sp. CBMA152 TaxID=1896312 RepID=UPI001660A2E9|nr:FG-GAP-like repeat-containing protein [Streptomyces sp. CBMA152]
MALSGGGTGPLAALADGAGHRLAVSFPHGLPAPTVKGNTALYAQVLPGVDLQASVSAQGEFSEVLVVHDATAAANPELKKLRLATSTDGLTLSADATGRLAAKAPDGNVVYASAAPLMWDSSTGQQSTATSPKSLTPAAVPRRSGVAAVDPTGTSSATGPGTGAKVQQVGMTAEAGALTLTPDANLLTGSATTYPVYIDPTFSSPLTGQTGHFTVAQEGCPSPGNPNPAYDKAQDNGQGVGYQHYSSRCYGMQEAYYEINARNLYKSMVISKSTLTLAETYGADAGCDNTWPVTLKETERISDSTSWDNKPKVVATIGTQDVKSAWPDCGTRYVNFDVTSRIRAVAAAGNDTWTFGLSGDDSTSSTNYGYMRFSANPYITTVFDLHPAVDSASTTPDSMNPSGAACNNGTPGWIGATTLTGGNSNIDLNARVATYMSGVNLKAVFNVWDNRKDNGKGNGSTVSAPSSPYVASGTTVHTNIGTAVQDGHAYGWEVHATDGTLDSPLLTLCHFNVDLTPPTPAAFGDSAAYPPLGSDRAPTAHAGDTGITIPVTSTDPTPTGCELAPCVKSGIRRFEYSLDAPIPPTGAKSIAATPDGSGTAKVDIPVNLTAQQWGTHTLYVQAVDGAGNARPSSYRFYAPWNPATKVTAGDLTGDGIPDLLTPDKSGSLLLVPGNTDPAATPVTASTASQSPDGTGWDNYLVAHRGSLSQSGVDDLFAYNKSTHNLYAYSNDANRNGTPGHFTNTSGIIPIPDKPDCNTASACDGYDHTWASVTQFLAPGSFDNTRGLADLITVENKKLWYYPGTDTGGLHLGKGMLLGTGDWSHATLIAPGTVGGAPTLWARDDASGVLYSYPLQFDANGIPTTLTAPASHTLVSGVTAAGGGNLCLDVDHGSTTNGTKIQVWGCNNSAPQQWVLGADNTVRNYGKCLDATGGGTANWTPIELYTCNGGGAQQWKPGPGGSLVNPASGRCLAYPSSNTTPGTQLILADCATIADQVWSGNATNPLPAQAALLAPYLDKATYPLVSSPGDVNSQGGDPDTNPDLYATTNRDAITEYSGKAPVGGLAQFNAPVTLGYLHKRTGADAEGDLNGDGIPDLTAIDKDGQLRVYPGTGNGGQANGPQLGGGWAGGDISHRGDWTGDGYEDLVAHLPGDASHLWLYRGTGFSGFSGRYALNRPAGSPSPDWSKTTQVITAGDLTMDSHPDLLAIEDDALYLFPGTADGQLATPIKIGTAGWNDMELLAPGDVNGDGLNDLWARRKSTGDIYQYLNDPLNPGTPLGNGSNALLIGGGVTTSGYPAVAAIGDGNQDGHPDLWTTVTSDDHLHFFAGNGSNSTGFAPGTDVSGGGWTTTIKQIA